ncbi:SDR family oxidoreductase [Flavobacterium sp.]|uniref:SDR family oxidoreductase n=1 Tax=Flavobacterium sp. TaxID=239 RepID=UPI002B4B049C|nr:SDR family oxidoreductase [Flavobacterium sp.]HLP64162.1 SDR family oxidoreductase [Flavobacterium sp.]
MKQISILGCGWLGLPLAKSFIEVGFSVNGSTTSLEKMDVLKEAGIAPFQINVKEDSIEGEMASFLENSSVLIIDIPPKLRGNSNENFVAKIQTVISFIEQSTIKKVLFVSSTSVYADDNSEVTENTKPQPETESGKQLLEAEFQLLNNTNFQTTVLRFGGLIGDDRHPIRFLSGKKNIENPNAPVNLIHQSDCIGIIQSIIENENWNEVFNAVTPYHPSRKEYYTQKAIELNLTLPEFDESNPSIGKLISSDKIHRQLNYTFKTPEL